MDAQEKRKLEHRLKIIRGHVDKVLSMVDKDEYCMNILQQTSAVCSSLKEVEQVILENHLKTCVKEALVSKEAAAEKVEEVIKIFKARK